MALSLKPYCLVVLFLFWISLNALVSDVGAAGECGRTRIRSAAASLSPCLGAARNARAKVPPACCAKVGALLRTSPRCLCAILLSPLAKQAGIMPGIAIAIPKKCNIRNRQAGKKCGSKYTTPFCLLFTLLFYCFALYLLKVVVKFIQLLHKLMPRFGLKTGKW